MSMLKAMGLSSKLVPGWRVIFRGVLPDADDGVDDAHVVIDRELREATVYFNRTLDEETLGFLLKHELVHVLLADMDFVACNGRSIEIMEIYNLFEERVCNTLAKVL